MTTEKTTPRGLTYHDAGVASGEDACIGALLGHIRRTLSFRRGPGEPVLPLGYYANVLRVGELGIAIGTDGVGTKVLVAQQLEKYDTIGIDCVAMNANDILCAGAEPVAMVDYLAVPALEPVLLEQLAIGLARGAELAGISLPGGEIAQLGPIIQGVHPERAFDLAGTCVGLVPVDQVLVGQDIQPGEAVIGLASSGIHSNGLALARHVFFGAAGWTADRPVPELGRSIGEELLEPTRIYVREVMALLRAGLDIKALFHITGEGFFNLTRTQRPVGFHLDSLPAPPPVFRLIQELGHVAPAEMYRVYNMGVGFCLALPEARVDRALAIAAAHNVPAQRIGTVTDDPDRTITLAQPGLVGRAGVFRPA
jgi:phosphoribosylformylglycinamidine cyclo-ligase